LQKPNTPLNTPCKYDYGFRQLDPQICRWHVIDAMAEKYLSTSPYAYVENNPISFTDYMGLWKSWEEINNIIDDLFNSPFGGTASSGGGGPSYFRNDKAAKSWAVDNGYYDPSVYKGKG
jgi:RHS repeat-associated protein